MHRLSALESRGISLRGQAAAILFFIIALGRAPSVHAVTPGVEWIRQFGTTFGVESNSGVAADALRNAFVTGHTNRAMAGVNAGGLDGFVRKFDEVGNVIWTRQFGTSENDYTSGATVDLFGNVVVAGYTSGRIGSASFGGDDLFVTKYTTTGSPLWTRQFGSEFDEDAVGVVADSVGNIFVAGSVEGEINRPNVRERDLLLSKLDPAGNLLWTKKVGTPTYDTSIAVAIDALDQVYITGATEGMFGGPHLGSSDAFVSKFDASGNLLWARQSGTTRGDQGQAIATDTAGNVYFAGTTAGNWQAAVGGISDTFVGKYDSAGNLLWVQQFGPEDQEGALGIDVDEWGNAYVGGFTVETQHAAEIDDVDAFVTKLSPGGAIQWTRQFASGGRDIGRAISIGPGGSLYLSGETNASLIGTVPQSQDNFLIRVNVLPEPAGGSALISGLLFCFASRRARSGRRASSEERD